MDDLAEQCECLSFNTGESNTVTLSPTVEDNSKVLVAHLFTKRRFSIEALSRTLRSMWRSVQNFEIQDLGSNTALLLFENEADSLKILAQGLWSFDKYLMGLYKPKEDESVDDATFDGVSFWVQIHNLPIR